MALGINQAAGISGTFIGLVLGGILAPIDWRLIFLVSVPIGLFGTVWAYLQAARSAACATAPASTGPATSPSPLGLIAVMVGITYGIEPYGGHAMGWTSPVVLAELGVGVGAAGGLRRHRDQGGRADVPPAALPHPRLHRRRAVASFLAAVGRGGLMFMLIIWLQGIWLPLHGYSFARTPLWAGIYMLPLTAGFLIAGPLSGVLSDRFGARPFATGGMLGAALRFVLLELLPIDFPYWAFAAPAPRPAWPWACFAVAQPGRRHEQPAARAPRRRRRA